MPSYIFATPGLHEFVQHSTTPGSVKHVKNIEIVSLTLSERACDPAQNTLLQLQSESSLLQRRQAARHLWVADCQALGSGGARGSFAIAFATLSAANVNISLSVTTKESSKLFGAGALFNQLGAHLAREHFEEGGCGKVIVAMLKATHSQHAAAPVKSLSFNLQNGYHTLGPRFTALQQDVVTLGPPRLGALKRLSLQFDAKFDPTAADQWQLFRMIVAGAPDLESLSLSWNEAMEDEGDYGATLIGISTITAAVPLRTLILVNMCVSHGDLIAYFGAQRGNLSALKLDNIVMLGQSGWRATLRWLTVLGLKNLELRDLMCFDRCEEINKDCFKVICGGVGQGWWSSHGVYEGAQEVADGLGYLAQSGEYFWADRLRHGMVQKAGQQASGEEISEGEEADED